MGQWVWINATKVGLILGMGQWVWINATKVGFILGIDQRNKVRVQSEYGKVQQRQCAP